MITLNFVLKNLARAATMAVTANVTMISAQVQELGPYAVIGAGYATSNADEIELVETEAGIVVVRAGYNFHRFLGVEAEGNFTALTPEIDPTGVNGREAALNFSRGVAGFVVARYPVGDKIELFARGGYHHTRIVLRAQDLEQSFTANNAAYGGGVSYNWDRNGVRAEYTVYNVSRENFDQRVFGLSFVRRF